jgi:hypothetical protein
LATAIQAKIASLDAALADNKVKSAATVDAALRSVRAAADAVSGQIVAAESTAAAVDSVLAKAIEVCSDNNILTQGAEAEEDGEIKNDEEEDNASQAPQTPPPVDNHPSPIEHDAIPSNLPVLTPIKHTVAADIIAAVVDSVPTTNTTMDSAADDMILAAKDSGSKRLSAKRSIAKTSAK